MPLPENVFRTSAADWEVVPPSEDRLRDRYTTEVIRLSPLGLATLGAHLEVLPPGSSSCPLHHHLVLEEHLFVLDGVLTVRELAPDADDYEEFEVHAGQLVAWPSATRRAHSIHNRSSSPVRVLVVSDRPAADVVCYPDSGKILATGLGGVGVLTPKDATATVDAQLAAANAEAARRSVRTVSAPPPHVATLEGVPERDLGGTFGRPLSRAKGARAVFVNLDRLPPGSESSPLHWHSANEELVLVLQGTPTLRQLREGAEERVVLAPGDLAHYAPGDRVAHQFINDSDRDVRVLVIGTDHPGDVCHFPDRGLAHVAAVRTTGAFSATSYWAGE